MTLLLLLVSLWLLVSVLSLLPLLFFVVVFQDWHDSTTTLPSQPGPQRSSCSGTIQWENKHINKLYAASTRLLNSRLQLVRCVFWMIPVAIPLGL